MCVCRFTHWLTNTHAKSNFVEYGEIQKSTLQLFLCTVKNTNIEY